MKSKRLLILVIILIAVIALAGVLWYVNRPADDQPEPAPNGKEGATSTEGELKLDEKHPLEEVFEHPEKFKADIIFDEKVDTSNWIFYENEVYSLYYPKNLDLIKNPLNGEADNIFKYNIKETVPKIFVYFNDYNEARFNRDKKLKINSNREIKIVKLDGYKGWYSEGINEDDTSLRGEGMFFIINDKIVTFGLSSENIDEEIVEIFTQIMSTVKFK